MKTWYTLTAAFGVAAMLAAGPALAQTKPNCQPSASPRGDAQGPKATTAPQKIEGQVTAVDANKGTITVRGNDGTTHEFKGSADTLKEYKKGDRIDMTLRSQPC
jgi:hypothetical protein